MSLILCLHDARGGQLRLAGHGFLVATAVTLDGETLAAESTLEVLGTDVHSHVVLHVALLEMGRLTDNARQELLASLVSLRVHECLSIACPNTRLEVFAVLIDECAR